MINFIILTNTKDDYIKSLTQTCIESIRRSILPKDNNLDSFRIIVIESNEKYIKIPIQQIYNNVTIIPYDYSKYNKFNYNYALNIGIDYCKKVFQNNDWFCFMNNDIIFDQKWLLAMSNAASFDPELQSFCCNLDRKPQNILKYGYATFVNLDGCCILCKSSVIDQIGLFDETFDFYFQDDDYCEQLILHKIKHAKVMNSLLIHVASQTIPEQSDMKLLFDGRDKFINKYGLQTYLYREREKYLK